MTLQPTKGELLKALKDQKEDTIRHCIKELPAFLSIEGRCRAPCSRVDFPDLRTLNSPYLGSAAVTPTGASSPTSPKKKSHHVFRFDGLGYNVSAQPPKSKKNVFAVSARFSHHL